MYAAPTSSELASTTRSTSAFSRASIGLVPEVSCLHPTRATLSTLLIYPSSSLPIPSLLYLYIYLFQCATPSCHMRFHFSLTCRCYRSLSNSSVFPAAPSAPRRSRSLQRRALIPLPPPLPPTSNLRRIINFTSHSTASPAVGSRTRRSARSGLICVHRLRPC
ncbi:hypothetical protein C8J57DRAFT_1373262, partial [Mycena rebaudengoi]